MIEKLSAAQITIPDLGFDEAIAAIVDADIGGIGIWEAHLGPRPDNAKIKRFIASGLKGTLAVPEIWSIMPNPWSRHPTNPFERIERICDGMRRLASFDPIGFCIQTGLVGDRSQAEAAEIVEFGLRKLARVAASLHPRGLMIALEPVHPLLRDAWSPITSLSQAVSLRNRVGESNCKIVLDTWHMADDPDLESPRSFVDEIAAVQIADRMGPADSWHRRYLPGSGRLDLKRLLTNLDRAGYTGWFELEIISDDGRFDEAVEDSLWKRPAAEILKIAQSEFRRLHKEVTGVPAN